MKCPNCKQNTLDEIESFEPNYMGYGWSIKHCKYCDYKVKDNTMDRRFAGVNKVLNEGQIQAIKDIGVTKREGKE